MARHYHRAQVYSSARFRLFSITSEDARELVTRGKAIYLSKRTDQQLAIQLVEKNRHLELMDIHALDGRSSPNQTDVFANALGRAGMLPRKPGKKIWDDNSGRRRRFIGNRVDQAMTKIEMWPLVGDSKAVRVGQRA